MNPSLRDSYPTFISKSLRQSVHFMHQKAGKRMRRKCADITHLEVEQEDIDEWKQKRTTRLRIELTEGEQTKT
jgi:hypothetical protein